MTGNEFAFVPAERREAVRDALTGAFGHAAFSPLRPVSGGASGALVYCLTVGERPYLLRLEPSARGLRDPARGLACMAIAAEAGVAPAVHFSDAAAGVSVMDLVAEQPLSAFPGGAEALTRALADLVARLQSGPAFPALMSYPALIERMLAFVEAGFVPGLLDPHLEGFRRIRDAYPWDVDGAVASHNDPNPRNILFDGTRLWLIDWETAYANDRFVDVAIIANNLAPMPAQAEALANAWLGRAPSGAERARLILMRALTTLYYAALMLTVSARPGEPPATDLAAMTPAAFGRAVEAGELRAGDPALLRALGRMQLSGFLGCLAAPGFETALAGARD